MSIVSHGLPKKNFLLILLLKANVTCEALTEWHLG